MGVAERSREHVETKLEELEETYGSFAINQTTITVPGEQYTSMRERGNPKPIAVYAAVENEDGEILHVDGDDDSELPGRQVDLEESLESTVREEVRDSTAVDCTVDGVEHVTIAGLRNAEDPNDETLYNLVVVFSATHDSGSPADRATWVRLDEGLQPAHA